MPTAPPVTSPSSLPAPLRVLHLSDLHARESTQWDASPLLKRLLVTLGEQKALGLGPDLVAITGDIAFGGSRKQYSIVEKWIVKELLPVLGLDVDALLIVPGNHDVNTAHTGKGAIKTIEDALRTQGQDYLAGVRSSPEQMGLLMRRYKDYLAFLKKLGHPAQCCWSRRVSIRGQELLFVGLDTAWLSPTDGGSTPVVVGLHALNEVLADRQPGEHVVALAHHSIDRLVDWDHRAILHRMRADVDVLLRGHDHESDASVRVAPGSRLVELPAGSVFGGSAYANSFEIVELDLAGNEVRAHVFVWSETRVGWLPDRVKYEPDGVYADTLR